MAGADAPAAALTDLAGQTLDVAKTLKRHQVSWQVQISGWQMHRPGRGQILTPPLNIQQYDGDGVVATFQFSRFHLGDGGVVHGGAIPLMVDELFSVGPDGPRRPHENSLPEGRLSPRDPDRRDPHPPWMAGRAEGAKARRPRTAHFGRDAAV